MSETLGHHLPSTCIKGYRLIKRLDKKNHKATYRALKIDHSRSVVTSSPEKVRIEILLSPYSHFSILVGLHKHFLITKNLPISGIVKPLELKVGDYGHALVMEDVEGISLKDYKKIQEPLLLEPGIKIAIQLADILHDLNIHQVLHKNINPASVLIHPENHKIWLTDFSIASLLPRETQSAQIPMSIEGTLEYIAPEQTGRMNRGIDFRTDFYSLGVTLYELLTHQLPFPSEDPIELMYCHLAKTPIAPHLINAKIPVQLSAIVLKLMAKNAEDRYQSATGLKHDLERCLQQLDNLGKIPEFALGQEDRCDRFIISEKLYGRETEVKVLLDSFARVAQGNSELMLVAGFSGIGKTALINEILKPISKQKGYFLKGKFDQLNRNIPFSAFVQAFSDLVKHLLAESNQKLRQWQQKILNALGNNAQLIIEVIPDLELILGKQPAVAELSGNAAQNRFNLFFNKFIQVFTVKDHPLVIFLDDLQWADSASLNLLRLLSQESKVNSNSLLVLGAYRDNEVFPAHPLMLCLEEIEQEKTCINTVTLEPLAESEINCLVADTLLCSQTDAAPLSNLIYLQTKGNPFFTTQFLKGLHDDGQIDFDQVNNYWQCHLSRIRELVLSDDVVEYMVGRLRKLPKETQEVLKLAACIGNQFDLETLLIVCESSEVAITNELWFALQAGLIIPLTENYHLFESKKIEDDSYHFEIEYKFLHDRVQQAAYCLAFESEQQNTHIKIGQRLLNRATQEDKSLEESDVFTIVNHFNSGLVALETESLKQTVLELNIKAGEKARKSIAYTAALNYFQIAWTLLPQNHWEQFRDLSFQLAVLRMETAYLNGDTDLAWALGEETLESAQTVLERSKIHEIQVLIEIARDRMLEAVELGLKTLNNMGIELVNAAEISQAIVLPEVSAIQKMDRLRDPLVLQSMSLMMAVVPPVFLATDLFPRLVVTMLKLSLEHGNSPQASYAFVAYGWMIIGVQGEINLGYQSGNLGLQLQNLLDTPELSTRLNLIFTAHILAYRQHLKTTIIPLRDIMYSGSETGDLEYAGYAAMHYCHHPLWAGEPLDVVATMQAQAISFNDRYIKHAFSREFSSIWQQLVQNLQGQNNNALQLAGNYFDEHIRLAQIKADNNHNSLVCIYLAKSLLTYLLGDYKASVSFSRECELHTSETPGVITVAIHNFIQSLSELAYCQNNQDIDTKTVLNIIDRNQRWLKIRVEFAPENFQHKYDLVKAERNRVLDNKLEALELYDKAIAGAKENGYIQEEALGNELAAKFYLDWGKEKVAAGYMQEAYDCYALWGAKAKTKHLEENYPDLLRPILESNNYSVNPFESLSSFSSLGKFNSQISQTDFSLNNTFDLTAILKSAQTLTSILEIDELLKQLSQIILKNSGCDRLVIALIDETDTWQIELVADREKIEFDSESTEINSLHPIKLINYVKNTQEIVLINNLETDLPIIDDYLHEQKPQSLFALPLKFQEKTIGVMYLHSSNIKDLFNPEKIIVLEFLCSQASIAIHNAQLYADANLKSKVIESSVDGMAILDDGKIIYSNERHARLFGYQPEELIGQSWTKLYSTEEADRFQQEIFTSLEDNGTWSGEGIALRKDRSTFPEEISLFLLDDRKLICICRDISDRKAIGQEQNRLIQILQSTSDFIVICQPSAGIVWQNKPFRKLRPDLKIAEEDIPISRLYPRWASDIVQEQGLPTATKYGTWSGETALLDQDGREIPVSQVIIAHSSATDPNNIECFSTILRDISDRKAAELALIESENKFRTLVDNIEGAVYRSDNTTECQFDYISPAIFHLTGYPPEDFTHGNRSYESLVHPEDVENAISTIKTAVTEHRLFVLEYRIIHRNGEIRWVTERGKSIYNQEGQAQWLEGVIFDISDRKASEKALQVSALRDKTIFDQASVGFIEIDVKTLKLIRVNDLFCQMTGYSAEELSQMELQVITHPKDLENFLELIDQLISGETDKLFTEKRFLNKNGFYFWCETTAYPIEFEDTSIKTIFGIIKDISDRKITEQSLIESESKFRTLVDNIEGAVYRSHNDADWTMDYMSPAIQELSGYPAEEFIQNRVRTYVSIIHPEDENYVDQEISEALAKHESFIVEYRIVHRNGDIHWVLERGKGIYNHADQLEYMEGVIFDISDRQKLEQKQKQLNTILEATTDYIGMCNLKGNTIWNNKRMVDLLKLPELEQPPIASFHPGWVNRIFVEEAFPSAIKEGTWSGETVVIDAEGKEIPVSQVLIAHKNLNGEVENFSTIMRDIRDRKKLEQELQLSEALSRAAFEQAAVGIVETDLKTGKYTRINNRFCEMIGYSTVELKLMSVSEFTHPHDVAKTLKFSQQLYQGEIENFTIEKRYIRKDGSYFWSATTVCLIHLPDGESHRSLAIIEDISDRKQSEQQLQELSEKLELAIESAQIGIWEWNPQTDQLSWNDRMFAIYGLESSDFRGTYKDWASCIHPEDLPQAEAELTQNVSDGLNTCTQEFRVVWNDGTIRHIFATAIIQRDTEGRHLRSVGMNLDITERRQSEEALMIKQNHLTALLDNIPHIAWIKDEYSRFIAANQPFAQACRTPLEDIIGKTDFYVWPADLAQKYRDDDFQVLSSGNRKIVEERVALADGTFGWLETTKTPFKNTSGDFAGTVGIAADLTDRKQAELALAESETKFRTLVENAQDIIFSMTVEAIFTYISPQVEHILGYSAERLVGQSCLSFVHPEDISLVANCLENIVSKGVSVTGNTIRMFHIDGGWRWLVFNTTPVKDASGNIVSMQGIGRDVTEKEQKEQALTAIVEGTAAKTGADFYRSCVRYLTDIFQVKYGFLTEINLESPLKSTVIVLWDGEEFAESYDIDLPGTPCQKTYEENIYIVHDSLPELFPEANLFASLKMESYASVAISNIEGKTIGNLGIMDTKALSKDSSAIEFILQLFATRVGAEMERQQTEDALRKSQAQLQAFLDNSPSVIYQKDLQGRYQILNQTLADLFNLDRDTFIGQTDFNVFPQDIAQQLRKNDQQVIVSKIASTLEEVIPHPDGSLHTYIATKFSLLDERGNPYALGGFSTDITELKQAELALQKSQVQFQRMTENVPGMIFRYIVHADGSEKLTYVSSQIEEIFAIKPETALQNADSIWSRVHPDDIARVNNDFKISAETLQPFTTTYRLILPNKGLRWVQKMSRPERLENGDVAWDGIVVDISDRKLIEAKQQRQLAILESTSDFIGTSDPQGKILYLNEAWRNLLQKDGQEPYHRHSIAEQHPAWALEIVMNEALPTAVQQGMWAGETAILDGNGIEIPVSQVVIAHKSKNGVLEYFSTIIRDMSDRKLAEEELQQTNEKLVRATRMKDEFMANMSHELRTPLNAILGMTEGLQEGIFGKMNREQINALYTIEQSGSHLLELIDEILDLTKIESGHVELEYSPVEVNQLCQSSLGFIKQQAQKKLIQLHLNTPFNLPKIAIDERRIRQVLINLLNNAVKFTPEGGSVTLEVSLSPSEKTSNQKYLHFIVKDTGIGIAEKDLQKLFQPFIQIDSTLRRQYEGTGLGLFLVKRIIDLHQGNIKVTSKVGVGSCFSIRLPYQSITSSDTVPQSKIEYRPITSGIKCVTSPLILLAEDNNTNSSIISTYLKSKGYRIQVAHNGQIAIELVQATQPNLILMDIQMPGMDGLTAIQHIRQNTTLTQVPIIALTAFAMEEDRLRCLAAGANMYLAKPVRLKNLVLTIQKLLVV